MTKPLIPLQKKIENKQQNAQKQADLKYNGSFQFYDQKQIDKYFKLLNPTGTAFGKPDYYKNQKQNSVVQLIVSGEVTVSNETVNVDCLMEKQRINQQQQKINSLKAKKSSILQQLSLLDQQLSRSKSKKDHDANLPNDLSTIHSKNNQQNNNPTEKTNRKLVLSKEQHKQLIMKLAKQHQEREKNRILLKLKEQQKHKIIEEEKRNNQLKRIEQQKKRKAQEIEEKLKKNKQKHQKFIEQQKESTKKVQQIKHKKFLHEQIEQKYKMNVKMPLLEEQKKLLKQKRQIIKAFSIDEIKNHQRAYMQLRESSIKKSQAKEMERTLGLQSYKVPPKSSRLEKILEDEKLEQRQKQMQKKRALEQKLQRQQNYVEYLKQNFSNVKIDKGKEQEIKERIQRSKPNKREDIDSRLIGLDYLQVAKKLRKKTPPKETNSHHGSDSPTNRKSSNFTVLSDQLRKSPVSQSRLTDDTVRGNNLMKKRQQHIENLIHNNSITEAERIRKLKMQTQRINEAFRMKQQMLKYGYSEKVEDEAVELLLTSIHAKMGIIDIGKDNLNLLKH